MTVTHYLRTPRSVIAMKRACSLLVLRNSAIATSVMIYRGDNDNFSDGKFEFLSPVKTSCDSVALPDLRCMLGVFSVSIIHPSSDMN